MSWHSKQGSALAEVVLALLGTRQPQRSTKLASQPVNVGTWHRGVGRPSILSGLMRTWRRRRRRETLGSVGRVRRDREQPEKRPAVTLINRLCQASDPPDVPS